jgi:peptide-methionine (R)-S-oxide reductase
MTRNRRFVLLGGFTVVGAAALSPAGNWMFPDPQGSGPTLQFVLTDAAWKTKLSPEAYAVLRKRSTEVAHSSLLNAETRPGTYLCGGCEQPVFHSTAKYDAATGWPSFKSAIETNVHAQIEPGFFGPNTAVDCARCGGHLGHVFKDGPPPTGLRYCINGVALRFVPTTHHIPVGDDL